MTSKNAFLFEIGTEELPPKSLEKLANSLKLNVAERLTKAGLEFAKIDSFATPRRLAILIKDLIAEQPKQTIERRGPAVSAAFDQHGKPTPAAIGFAKSCNISLDKVEHLQNDKGTFLYYQHQQPGMQTTDLMPEIITQALKKLPIPKLMRWNIAEFEFIRPVHWAVMLFGDQTISANILGVAATNQTYGHRFHHPQAIVLQHAGEYEDVLAQKGYVIADFKKRYNIIGQQINTVADKLGKPIIDSELLTEVTGLVEWPVAVLCEFPQRFIELPKEVLISPMQKHLRCFPIKKSTSDELLPYFIAVSNIKSKQPEKVKNGYERVINARFSDAKFFYQQDLVNPLADYVEKLKTVTFQIKLGSIYDKVERIIKLAEQIAQQIGVDPNSAKRSAYLAKADLVTNMVGEFPELQGIMGYYYAKHQHERDEITIAIKEQYSYPENFNSIPLGIADRLDTLIGIFAINQPPTGDKDPFGLRRAALSILRIIIGHQLPLDLQELITSALQNYNRAKSKDWNPDTKLILDFLFDRLYYEYLPQGNEPDVLNAILACRPTKPFDFAKRVTAVKEFKKLSEAESLIAANKRVSNILEKSGSQITSLILEPELLQEPFEQELAKQLEIKENIFNKFYLQQKYTEALKELVDLKTPIDNFFDKVMVMVDNEKIRNNRLALLAKIRATFIKVADVSLIQKGEI
jgi:glycyl-tRNA synthetase beta chain